MHDSPLSKAQLAALQKLKSSAAEALKKCDQAEAAGVPCDDLKAMVELQMQRASQIQRAMDPGAVE